MLGLAADTWTALGVGAAFGFTASLVANAVYNYILRPDFTIQADDSSPAPGVRPSIGPYAFFHVIVVSSSRRVLIFGRRRIPHSVRAWITIQDKSRSHVFVDGPARWAGCPEPLALVSVQSSIPGQTRLVPHVDPKEIARQRSFDFESPAQREQIDLVLKVDGQAEAYFWNNDNYTHG